MSKDEIVFWTLLHFDIQEDDDETEIDEALITMKRLGFYSSEEKAKEALDRFKKNKKFQSFPGGFRIYDGTLDWDIWRSGFIEYP